LFKSYYQLTKPGIIYGNAMTAAAGFLLASGRHINFRLFLGVLIGTCLVIASACVFNNYIDREIDKKMARTKKRAIASGLVPPKNAIIFATLLGFIGFVTLVLYTNLLVVLMGAVAFVVYVVVYGISKRQSVHGTVVGSIAGAAPIVAGYCAVTDHFGVAAFLLFIILASWQMPHFYAIAMYRFDDYAAANLPVLPVKKGLKITKIQILCYVMCFIVAANLLTVFGYTSGTYSVLITALGLAWFWLGVSGFSGVDDKLWARKMFFFSLIIILSLSVLLSTSALLP